MCVNIMDISELFWNCSLCELKNGFVERDGHIICLLCGERLEKGIIYPDNGIYYEAERFMRLHIEKAHNSVFEYMLGMNRKFTGLTDHQCNLLRLFYQGRSDREIREEMVMGSTSTVRHHRYVLKEKERQARIFLTLMELLRERDVHSPSFVTIRKTAGMIDERYNVTTEERERVIEKFFLSGPAGPISAFPPREKQRLILLQEIIKRFESGRSYGEREVNEILQTIYDDHVLLRRYLVEYGFMERKADGSVYRVKQ